MAARLTPADVERIAALAHLELTDEEKQLFATQLDHVLAYAEQVQTVDTSGVEATATVHTDITTTRLDVPRPSLSPADAVGNAPDRSLEPALFRVPRVLGD